MADNSNFRTAHCSTGPLVLTPNIFRVGQCLAKDFFLILMIIDNVFFVNQYLLIFINKNYLMLLSDSFKHLKSFYN